MSYQPVGGRNNNHYGVNDNHNYGGNQYNDDDNYSPFNGAQDTYPMGSGNPYAATSSSYPKPKKSRKKLWWILGILLLLAVIAGAVVGGVLGSRNSKNNNNGNKGSSNNDKVTEGPKTDSSGKTTEAAVGGGSNTDSKPTGSGASGDGVGANTALPTGLQYLGQPGDYKTGSDGEVYLALATDTYMLPAYATGTNTAGYSAPTQGVIGKSWPTDPDTPSSSAPRAHPRLIAPKYKWDALADMVAADPYIAYWNATIVQNASDTLGSDVVEYRMDGGPNGSGVLDVAREIKLKVKNWAYAYKVTGNSAYTDRVWKELQHGAGQSGTLNGAVAGDPWNCGAHFLDCAEFTSAYAIAYDWLYDQWSDEQKTSIRGWIVDNGLKFGQQAYGSSSGWWFGVSPGKGDKIINGNWNCVSNAGMLLGSLAIQGDDTSGIAEALIPLTIDGAKANCYQGAYSDGTWAETANYWYFGTTGAAEFASALDTAYAQDLNLDSVNAGWKLTSLYHMYVQGMTSLFNYGDHGPNKFSSTANSLLLWSKMFNEPRYALYQRDHYDASEPFALFWYDPSVSGAWWNGLAYDRYFNDENGQWGTARSSWSDNSGSYWAMKASKLTGHQTHGDLDVGDFVFDAMGQRWAGELGSGQYLSPDYFTSEDQNAARWQYYRKATEGQNTILIGKTNQLVSASPSCKFDSSGNTQGPAPYVDPSTTGEALMTCDMSSAYANNANVKRGIRYLSNRLQLLVQDEVTAADNTDIQWRMNTNATVDIAADGQSATLTLADQTVKVSLLNAQPSGLKFSQSGTDDIQSLTLPPKATADDNLPNPGTTVLIIDNPAGGTMHTEVLFTPQWAGKSDSDYNLNPKSVAIDSWGLDSHSK